MNHLLRPITAINVSTKMLTWWTGHRAWVAVDAHIKSSTIVRMWQKGWIHWVVIWRASWAVIEPAVGNTSSKKINFTLKTRIFDSRWPITTVNLDSKMLTAWTVDWKSVSIAAL